MSDMRSARRLTIVTWHYVRDDAPVELYARSVAEFSHQLDHIGEAFIPVRLDDVAAAAQNTGKPLPANACLLTFDDGYRDHYDVVFPALAARGWQGVFFPVVRAARDGQVLDVNKIQFAIASAGLDVISLETCQAIDEARDTFDLKDSRTLYKELATAGLHNPPEAMFVKRALQTVLPAALRARICTEIFERHVSTDEAAFAADLYAGIRELQAMRDGGMAIGGHGQQHERMNALSPQRRAEEFEGSRAFLEILGVPVEDGWSFCYPYGAHDTATLAAARAAGCTTAFVLTPEVADLDRDDILALPRIDTNDLPH